jgi:hypothetical protein
VQVRRELGVALLAQGEMRRAIGRGEAVKKRHVELICVTVMIACGVGAELGMLIAWMTFR